MKYHSVLEAILIVAVLSTATVSSTAQYFDRQVTFLKETHNQHDKKLCDFLIVELNQFAESFPDSEQVAEVYYLLARVYEKKGKQHEALAAYYKTIYLYPNTNQHKESIVAVQKIIAKEKAYRNRQEKLLAILDGGSTGKTIADRNYAYLNFLMELDESKLYDWTLVEARRFVSRFPNDTRIDMVLQWIADSYARKGKAHEAAVSYLRLDYTHPNSPLLPSTGYNRGMLLYKEMGKSEDAITAFTRIVTVYPESEYARESLFILGEIKKKMKDYEGAIAEYRNLVYTYPQYKKSVYALFNIGEINAKKLRNYPAAVAAYNEIVEKYPSHLLGVKALEKIGDIYKDNIKDYKRSAEYYAKIAELYPAYDKAPEMLLKAGAVCEDKLKDYEKAIVYYQIIVDKYSEHKKAGDAEKKITKARNKMGK